MKETMVENDTGYNFLKTKTRIQEVQIDLFYLEESLKENSIKLTPEFKEDFLLKSIRLEKRIRKIIKILKELK